jgi:tetratricopeptide (TPR) repeat protein
MSYDRKSQNPESQDQNSQNQNLASATEFLENGKKLFEKEKYKEAIAQLEKAQLLIAPDLALSSAKLYLEGEIQIWLANTYDVLGDITRAISICQKLTDYKDPNIAKQANYLLTIFSAPPLSKLEDVTSTLPNLQNLDRSQSPKSFSSSQLSENNSDQAIAATALKDQVPMQTNNLLIWLAIITFSAIAISLGIWLSRFA